MLTFAAIGHIAAAAILARRARAARPVKYAHRKQVQGSYAARTMRWGGVIILLFVIYHILDLTTGTLNPVGDPEPAVRPTSSRTSPSTAGTSRSSTPSPWWRSASTCGTASSARSAASASRPPRVSAGPASSRWSSPSALIGGYLMVPFAVLTGLVC